MLRGSAICGNWGAHGLIEAFIIFYFLAVGYDNYVELVEVVVGWFIEEKQVKHKNKELKTDN